ncbi:SDR family NAD(P)-dependent oxidoreductase [Leptolyngbya sp. 7M]|uniref:SDR family NAD(P)-dependent oxidoreductase n=1 Tax=Leptolyngbya sp. 7M TaxID=2812896 RepID=UPI0021F0C5E2|nr:SDR family NAD(P)-dependent oxidoreductase [Leptolyngbya sp. 7M]
MVSGASAGIGLSIARTLVSAGASVVLNARRADRLEALVAELGPSRAAAVAGDCVEPAIITRMLDTARERFGRGTRQADLVVVNAGRGLRGSPQNSDDAQWEEVIRTNTLGAARLIRAADASMITLLQTEPLAEQLPLRILVAEDNVVNQKVILKLLQRLGYQAEVVRNGLEVLDALARQVYDVILMDVQMPEMDGLAATRQINRLPQPRPHIIAVTASAMQGDREECLRVGMDDYLSKPLRLDSLHQALSRCRVLN